MKPLTLFLFLMLVFVAADLYAQGDRVLFLYGSVPPGTDSIEMVRLDNTEANGYSQLADLLKKYGFAPEERQDTSPTVNPLTEELLSQFTVVVFGSNNRRFRAEEQAAVVRYVAQGGAIFLFSDSQFGPSPDPDRRALGAGELSDNDILQHFAMALEHDNFVVVDAESERFVDPKHPILDGVQSFRGEGVSLIRVDSEPGQILVRGDGLRLVDGSITDDRYAITAIAESGDGRVAVTFDRNTFFNADVDSDGTDLSELDNMQYAINLFNWLRGAP
jgi:hypothetical protein